MKKSGQISLYVVIGIVVLTTIVTAFYARNYISNALFNKNLESSIIIPEKIKPINTFVLSCLKETADNALKIAGQQGGYTRIPKDPLGLEELNLVSNALTTYGNNKVAYWFYEQPNGVQKTQVPSSNNIEMQLSFFVENEFENCINNFKEFPEYEIKQGDVKVTTTLNEDNVVFDLDYPLEIKIKGINFKINKFRQEIESPIYNLFNSALKIFDNLNDNDVLELKTTTMLIANDEIPYSGSTDECIPPIWAVSDVEKNLKDIISKNIQALKVRGTNYKITNSEDNYFVIEPNLKDPNLDVNFLYSENWPLNLDINPREGGILKAQSVTEKLGPLRGLAESFACVSTYHFIYDLKYPVLVILNKNGYTFQFGMQVIIDKNEPRQRTIFTNSFEDFDTRICDARNKELTVFTRDNNNQPLTDVEIKYKCINSQCDIGKTRLNSFNDAVLTEKYPQCLNGAIIASKDGYHFSKETTSTLESSTTTLFLEPYKSLDVDVLIERAGSGKLEKDEQVYIQLLDDEKENYQTILYPDTNKINLISGNYKVIIYIISNYPEGLDIKEQTISTCFDVPKAGVVSGFIQQKEKKCVKTIIPATTVNKIISGYTEFNFEVTPSDLNSNKILFHVPYIGKPTKLSDLSRAFENTNVPKPEFK